MRLKAPKGHGNVSVGGVFYEADKGFVEVPGEAAAVLLEMGFTEAPALDKGPPAGTPAPPAETPAPPAKGK